MSSGFEPGRMTRDRTLWGWICGVVSESLKVMESGMERGLLLTTRASVSERLLLRTRSSRTYGRPDALNLMWRTTTTSIEGKMRIKRARVNRGSVRLERNPGRWFRERTRRGK